jgi:DNA mismatch endonuclease Vsr
VRVAVEGDGDAGVAQHLGNDLGVDAGIEHQGGGGVAQVVESDQRQPFPSHERSQAALGDARTVRLSGTPDLAFLQSRVAVFVDGDFWHGRLLTERGPEALRSSLQTPKSEWWVSKLTANVARDRRADAALFASGWTVIRLWERDVKGDPIGCADRVCDAIHAASTEARAESRHT